MELCDLYTSTGAPTGRTVPRGTALAPGEYYLVVHVWIRDETGAYLIQRRALDLAADPGVWAITAGYAQTGQDSLTTARRETREELGLALAPAQLRRWQRLPREDRLQDLWLAQVTRAALGPPALGPEVIDYAWATQPALRQRRSQGTFFPYSYFDQLPA